MRARRPETRTRTSPLLLPQNEQRASSSSFRRNRVCEVIRPSLGHQRSGPRDVRLPFPRLAFGNLENRDGLDAAVRSLVGDRLPLGQAEQRRADRRQNGDRVGTVPARAWKTMEWAEASRAPSMGVL